MLVPNPDRLLVVPVDREEQTVSPGGILLGNPQKPHPTVEVVAVGDNINGFTKGDECIVATYGGVGFKWEGVEYFILSPSEVLAIVRK